MKKNATINTKVKYTESEKYQKHFNLEDRIKIQKIIAEHRDKDGRLTILLKDIGNMLQNDPSTISKEVKNHRISTGRNSSSYLGVYNSICKKYKTCKIKTGDAYNPHSCMKSCYKCIDKCKEFEKIVCPHLTKFPWVCNGCPKASSCYLEKWYYYSDEANKEYRETLVESREGVNLTPEEFKVLNHTVSEYVKMGQPIYHIFKSNDFPIGQRTIYNYFEKGYLDAKNIDLRRKVAYKKRYKHREDKTILRKIKKDRTYEDFQEYMKNNPDVSIVEMDTVLSAEGSKKTLLTLHFVKFHFQLAYILPNKESETITAAMNSLCNRIGIEYFKQLFSVILTDNGNEFADPEAIEVEPETGEIRSKIFFCHPYRSGEKGACEKNHEYIRCILPKGTVFEFLNQEKCNLMMSHINSTKRPSVQGTPFEFMVLTYGPEILDLLQIKKIDSDKVILLPRLLTD